MSTKSNKKVVLKSIIIARDGKRVSPPIGKAFPFTDDEVEAILAANPTAIRDAVNEDEQADEAEVVGMGNSNTRIVPKNVKAGAGKTSAMVDGLDGTASVEGESGSDSAAGKTPATTVKGKTPAKTADDDL